ncbi:hypothetical protein AKO1_006018 [Acrasis kona]|uniref:Uncharacterized protein n=1 Tax=Acrasis kona TaxID=1008807 RepID=A0AAW2YQK4_9EUKA
MYMKLLLSLCILGLLACTLGGDIPSTSSSDQASLTSATFKKDNNKSLVIHSLSVASSELPSLKCPKKTNGEKDSIGRGNIRRQSKYFLAKGYKLAASCRIDCMSKVSDQAHFDGGCKQRFFYYGNTGSCLLAGELDESQAKLAEAYCMSCNGCIKTHNRAFTKDSAKTSVGDNSAKLPH